MTKKSKCTSCTYFNGKDCTHKTNIGLLLHNRKEAHFYIKPVEQLQKGCKNYAKA